MGLFVFEDVDNWIFFGLTNHNFIIGDTTVEGDGLIVTSTENGVSSIVTERDIEEDFAFLKIKRRGDEWQFWWRRQNGEDWHLLTTLELALTDHQVGMGVKTFDLFPTYPGSEGAANFDFFLIKES